MNQPNKNSAITARDVDFAQWYTDVCKKAELMDYSSVKGFIDYLPYGYAIWEEIQSYSNNAFKEKASATSISRCVIPFLAFQQRKEHIEGFAPECLGRDDRRWREIGRSPHHPSDFGDSFLRYV
jgi:prolyl-tRNA synthetase